MLPTFKYMESATAVNESKEPAYIYAPQTTPTSLPVNNNRFVWLPWSADVFIGAPD